MLCIMICIYALEFSAPCPYITIIFIIFLVVFRLQMSDWISSFSTRHAFSLKSLLLFFLFGVGYGLRTRALLPPPEGRRGDSRWQLSAAIWCAVVPDSCDAPPTRVRPEGPWMTTTLWAWWCCHPREGLLVTPSPERLT